jgi:hypothetical protein
MIAHACKLIWPYVYGSAAERAVLAALYNDAQINAPKDGENPCHAACLLLWGRFDPEKKVNRDGQQVAKFVTNPSANKYAHAMRLAHEKRIAPGDVADWIADYPGKLRGIELADQKAHPYRAEPGEDEKELEQEIAQRIQAMRDLKAAKAALRTAAEKAQLGTAQFARAVIARSSDGEWSIFAVLPESEDAARADAERLARADLRQRRKQEREKARKESQPSRRKAKAGKARAAETTKAARLRKRTDEATQGAA